MLDVHHGPYNNGHLFWIDDVCFVGHFLSLVSSECLLAVAWMTVIFIAICYVF